MVKSRQRWYNNPINITDGRFGCSFNGFSRLNDWEDGAVMNIKIDELLAALKKKEEEQDKNTVLWVLAISRYCLCCLSLLCSGLSGGFWRRPGWRLWWLFWGRRIIQNMIGSLRRLYSNQKAPAEPGAFFNERI